MGTQTAAVLVPQEPNYGLAPVGTGTEHPFAANVLEFVLRQSSATRLLLLYEKGEKDDISVKLFPDLDIGAKFCAPSLLNSPAQHVLSDHWSRRGLTFP